MQKAKLSNELIDYIEKALETGQSQADIEQALLDVGHKKHVVASHMKHVTRKQRSNVMPILITLGVIIFAVLAFIFTSFGGEQDKVDAGENATVQTQGASYQENNPLLNDASTSVTIREVNTLYDILAGVENKSCERMLTKKDKEVCNELLSIVKIAGINKTTHLLLTGYGAGYNTSEPLEMHNTACVGAQGILADICAEQIPLIEGIKTECEHFTHRVNQYICTSHYYYQLAQEQQNKTQCAKIPLPMERLLCQATFVEVLE